MKRFPTSQWAAKSLYAIGWIHENHKSNTKEAIKKYRQLLEDYPNSTFSALVKAKIDTVEKYFPSKPKIDPKKDSTAKKVDSLNALTKLPSGNVSPC